MAGGSFGLTRTGSTTSYASFKVDWSSYSNGSAANSSTVNVDVWITKSTSSTSNTWGTHSTDVSVSGGGSKNAGGSFTVSPGGSTLLFRNSFTVPHGEDGSRKTTISVNIGGNVIWANGSQEVTLDTIPRAGTITEAPNFTDEDNPTIKYSNPAGNAATIQACIADINGNVQYAKYRNISSTGSSYTFNLTDDERQALINAVPDGDNEMYVRFYVKTIINNATVGTPKYLQRILTVINTEPEITSVVKDIGSYSVGTLTKDELTMIKGFNHMHATMSVKLKKGATIVKQTIQNGATVVEGSAAEFPSSEDNRFIFTVTDTFGNTVSEESYLTLTEYVKLTCNIVANNPTADGDMAFKISGNYFNDKFGNVGVDNTLTVQWRYKENNGEYGEWIPVTPVLTDNTYSITVNLQNLNYKSSYTLQARAIDMIDTGGVPSPERLVRAIPVFNWGEDNFDIQVPLTVDKIVGNDVFRGPLELGSFDSDTGVRTDHESQYRNVDLFEVERNATYNITINGVRARLVVLFYDTDGNFIFESREVKNDGFFTTPSNAAYMNFRCFQDDFVSDLTSLDLRITKASPIKLIDLIYPVGSIYISVSDMNPTIFFGGTWEQIQGRFLLGVGTNDGNTVTTFGTLSAGYTTINAGDKGGKYVHTLSTSEMPSHTHGIHNGGSHQHGQQVTANAGSGGPGVREDYKRDASGLTAYPQGIPTEWGGVHSHGMDAAGGSQPHTNMPPYLGVYMWKRIA